MNEWIPEQYEFEPRESHLKRNLLVVIVVIAFAVSIAYVMSKGESWIWTWEATVQTIDPETHEVISTETYTEMARYIENRTIGGFNCAVRKSIRTDRPGEYSLDYTYAEDNRVYKIMSEDFYADGSKRGEKVFAEPLLSSEYPLVVGNQFSDNVPFSGYDHKLGFTSTNGQATISRKVLRKETVTVPAGTFECYVVSTTSSFNATAIDTVTGKTVQFTVMAADNAWWSESVGTTVKSIGRMAMTITITDLGTQNFEIHSKSKLVSYSTG